MSTALPKGFVIGGMTLGAPLGNGGFGITYLARDNKTKQKLALKEYFPAEFADRTSDMRVVAKPEWRKLFDMGLDAFLSEANILKTLPRQPGLVRVRGAFAKMETAYCVMEYIEGDPMDKMIPRVVQQYGSVPEGLIEQFVVSITQALSAVHSKKLIHRDVKPGNVMIRRDGQPVLIDFGAARPYGKAAGDALMFTRKYAAIEQFPSEGLRLRRRLREGPWSDLYSLSVMLYEMVARRVPPDAMTRMEAVQQGKKDPYVPVAAMLQRNKTRDKYSDRLLEMIDFGCALLPENRPANATAYCRIYTEKLAPQDASLTQHEQFGMAEKVGTFMRGAATKITSRKPPRDQRTEPQDAPVSSPQKDTSKRKGVVRMLGLIFLLAVGAAIYGWIGQPSLEDF
ncbi:serine/threonine protein kinase [Litoreibacter roseus]|uniref:non-specific serine/threonine protein kinase n=1 Tax=Litoreibacter roseus TaxID=2601869 RepID=A0A6N6JFM5_9RHOB|nr:serine/threonine-protein kinase [Litoreibacter roseus]GFE64088.1 serine/threonine protein kinase [Litoreibacter roseus]